MAESKVLSVVVPAYNRAKLIGQTLSSLLNQTLPADEIIVVDDGSTDSTVDAAEAEFAVFRRQFSGKGKLPEFKVIRQKNAGPGAARNRGFAESRGEFIHFFDSDDIAAPNKHEVQVRALQETGADIAYGPWVKGYIREHEAGPLACSADGSERSGEQRGEGKRYSFEPEGHVLQQKGLPKGDLIKELLTRWSVVPHACLFRRSIVEKVGGFPSELFGTEDQMMFLRCLLNGARVVHTHDTIEFYRLGDAFKITAAGAAQQRHAKEWAKFLASARRECLEVGIDPMKWEGFRRRVWCAELDLEKFGVPKISEGIENLPRLSSVHRFGSTVSSQGKRVWGGLKQRIVGDRHNTSFRCGPLRPAQNALFLTSLA